MAAQPATFTRLTANARPAAPTLMGWSLHRALVVGAFVTLLFSINVYNGGDVTKLLRPDLVLLIPGLVAAALLVQRETPGRLLGGALAMAIPPIMVLFVFGAVAGVANPLEGTSYLSVMLLLVALLLAVPAGVQGFRALRAGDQLPRAAAWHGARLGRFAFGASALLLGLGLAGVLAGAQVGGEAGAGYDFAPDASVAVAMRDFAFAPEQVRIAAGQVTEVVVTNEDSSFHTFTYQAGGSTYNHDVPGGATVRFLVKPSQAGSFQYWCEPHSGGAPGSKTGMVGALVVA